MAFVRASRLVKSATSTPSLDALVTSLATALLLSPPTVAACQRIDPRTDASTSSVTLRAVEGASPPVRISSAMHAAWMAAMRPHGPFLGWTRPHPTAEPAAAPGYAASSNSRVCIDHASGMASNEVVLDGHTPRNQSGIDEAAGAGAAAAGAPPPPPSKKMDMAISRFPPAISRYICACVGSSNPVKDMKVAVWSSLIVVWIY